MARNLANYLSNFGKSVVYSTVDRVKNEMPAVAEFHESNQELFKDIYDNVYNFRSGMNRSYNMFKSSKVFEAADAYKKNLFEDIKNGTFYNKKRDDQLSIKAMGSAADFSDFDTGSDDMNFDTTDIGGWDDEEDDDSPTARSTSAISMAVAKTGEYIVENQRANTNLFYAQFVRSNREVNNSLETINQNIGSVLNFSNDVLKVHVQNSQKYYETTTALLEKGVKILEQMQNQMTMKEEKQKQRTTYDSLAGSNGTVNLKEYMGLVKKNISTQLSQYDFMTKGMGDNSNPLLAFAASPLKGITDMVAKKIIPDTITASMKMVDKSISGLFGSVMSRFNDLRRSDNPILSMLGETLGVVNRTKGSLDTSKYYKGNMHWNGKANKALVEVIPNQIAEIISILSGKPRKLYDFDKGKFIQETDLAKKFEDTNKSSIKTASSDMRDEFNKMLEVVTFNSKKEREQLLKDMDKFFENIFHSGKTFIPGKKDNQYDFSEINSKNFKLIETMFKNATRSTQLKFNGEMMSARDRQYNTLSNLEKDGNSVLLNLFNDSGVSRTKTDPKKIQKELNSVLPNIKNVTDNKGNNVFFYLQNIYKELISLNNGNGGSGYGGRANKNATVIGSDGVSRTITAKEFEIPNNFNDKDAKYDISNELKQNEKYIRREKDRLKKIPYSVNVSDLDDDQIANAFKSALDVQKIKTKLQNQKEQNKRSLIDKLLEAETVTGKVGVLLDKMNEMSKRPVEFFNRTLEKVDQRIYSVIYGDENSKDKGFMETLTDQIKGTFTKVNNWIDDTILDPLKKKLDVDDLRDAPKKMLKKIGIDVDEIKKGIHDFFFDKEKGILSPIKTGIKETFKSFGGMVKNSVGSVISPIKGKFKASSLKSKMNKDFKNLDAIDEEILNQSPIKKMNKVLNGIDHATYDNMSDKQKIEYLQNYLNYQDNIAVPIAQNRNEAIKRQRVVLNKYTNKKKGYEKSMAELQRAVEEGTISNEEYEKLSKKINRRQSDKDRYKLKLDKYNMPIYNSVQQQKEYDEHKKRLDVLNKKALVKQFREYYGKNLQDTLDNIDGDDLQALEKAISLFTYKNSNNDEALMNFNMGQLVKSARKYGKMSKNSAFGTLADKLVDFSKAAEINPNMTIEDIIKLKPKRKQKSDSNSDSIYENFPNLINGNINAQSGASNSALFKILDSVKNIEKYTFTLVNKMLKKDLTSDSNGFTEYVRDLPLPTGFKSKNLNTPEGGAMKEVAGKIGDLVANWFGGNIKQYFQGGGIDKTQMVTVSEGEAVLNKETVDTLTGLMGKLTDAIVSKKDRMSKIAKDNFGSFVDLSKKLKIDDNEKFKDLMNKYVDKETLENMSDGDRKRYDSLVDSLSGNATRASGLKDNIAKSLTDDIEPFIKQTGDIIKNGARMASDSLFGVRGEDERKKGEEYIKGIFKDAKKYLPELSGGAVLGAGLSLLTGGILGPLSGAAIGASINLVKRSDQAQEWLFGKADEDGNRQGGILKANTINKMKKYLPDVKNFGITGGLAGLVPFLPFGPVGGVLLGSAFGFAKNNEGIQKALFGDENSQDPDAKKGIIPKSLIKKITKTVPHIALGTAGGLMFGPFGILGNMVLGSGMGYLSTSEKFQNMMLGKYNPNTKKYENGILPDFRDRFIEPLRKDMKGITDKIGKFVQDEMLTPLKSALDPILNQFKKMGRGLFKTISGTVDAVTSSVFGVPISKVLRTKIIQPVSDILNTARKTATSMAKKIITAPFKGIAAIGNHFRKKDIKSGDADYMTAEERLKFRKDNNMHGFMGRKKLALKHMLQKNPALRDKMPKSVLDYLDNPLSMNDDRALQMDKFLAGADYDELSSIKNDLNYINMDRKTRKNTRKKYSDNIYSELEKFGYGVSKEKDILKDFENGDTLSAIEKINKNNLSAKEKKTLDIKNTSQYLKSISNNKDITADSVLLLKQAFGKDTDADTLKDLVNHFKSGNMDSIQSILNDKLSSRESERLFNKLSENHNQMNSNNKQREEISSDFSKKLDAYGISNDNKKKILRAMSKGDYELAESLISVHKNYNDKDDMSRNASTFMKNINDANSNIKDLRSKSEESLKKGLDYGEQVKSAMRFVDSNDPEGLKKYLDRYVSDPKIKKQIMDELPGTMKDLLHNKKNLRKNTSSLYDNINSGNLDGKTKKRVSELISKGDYDGLKEILGNGLDLNSQVESIEKLFEYSRGYNKFDENSKEREKVEKELRARMKKQGMELGDDTYSFNKYLEMELKNRHPNIKEDKEPAETKKSVEKERIEVETKNHNEIVKLFSSTVTLLSELVKIQKGENKTGNTDYDTKLGGISNGRFKPKDKAESGAMRDVAKDITELITNYFGNNINQFAKGGYIHKTQMATLSAGETVLTKEQTNDIFGLSVPIRAQIEESKENHKHMIGLFTSMVNLLQQIATPGSKLVKVEDKPTSIMKTVENNITKSIQLKNHPTAITSNHATGSSDRTGEDMEAETDDGVIRYKYDSKNNKIPDLSDSETRNTIKKRKGLLSTVAGKVIDKGRSFKDFMLGKDKEELEKQDKKNHFFGDIGKKIGAIVGLGIMAKMLLPIVKPVFEQFVKPFITNTLLPGIMSGAKALGGFLLDGIKSLMPTLISGLGEAFKFAITDLLPIIAPIALGVNGVKLAGSLGKSWIKDRFTGKKTVKDTFKNFGKKEMGELTKHGALGTAYNVIRHPLKTINAVTKRGISLGGSAIGKGFSFLKNRKSGGVKATASKGLFGKVRGFGGGIKSKAGSVLSKFKFGRKKKGNVAGEATTKKGKGSAIVGGLADAADAVMNTPNMLENVSLEGIPGPQAAIIRQIQITGENIVSAILGGSGSGNGLLPGGGEANGGVVNDLANIAINEGVDRLAEKGINKVTGAESKELAEKGVKQLAEGETKQVAKKGIFGSFKSRVKSIGGKGRNLLSTGLNIGKNALASSGLVSKGLSIGKNALSTGKGLLSKGLSAGKNLLSSGKGFLGSLAHKGAALVGGTAVAGAVAKGMGKSDIETGAKKSSEGILSKISKKVTGSVGLNKVVNGAADSAASMAQSVEKNGIIKQIVEFLKNLLTSGPVKGIIGGETCAKIMDKLIPKVVKVAGQNLLKAAPKIVARMTSTIASGGVLNVAWAAADFVSGYNDAKAILSITDEPSFGMKITAGLVKAISGLSIITTLIPENTWVDIFIDTVLPAIGKNDTDLQKKRTKAQREVAEFNAKNGTNYSIDEYNKNVKGDKGFFGSMKDYAMNAWIGAKNLGSKIINKGKDILQGAWTGVKNGASWLGNKVVDTYNWAKNGVSNAAQWAGNKISEFGSWASDKATAAANGFKSFLGFGNGPSEDEMKQEKQKYKGRGAGGANIHGMVYYSQGDDRWGSKMYGTGTMKGTACGPTSAAMVLSSLLGKTILPTETAEWSLKHGYRIPNAGTSWEFFPALGKAYGVELKNVGTNKNSILSALKNKQPVIFSGQGAVPFTRGGHFIVGAGLDSNGDIQINDPVSAERSKSYSQSNIFGSMANAWVAGKSVDGKSMPNGSSVSGNDASGDTVQGQPAQQPEEPSLFNMFGDLGKAMSNSLAYAYENVRAGGFGEQVSPELLTAMGAGQAGISNNLLNFIKCQEGFYANRYDDGGGVITIGFGSTHPPAINQSHVTEKQAEQYVLDEWNNDSNMKLFNKWITKNNLNLSPNQYDALADIVYNAGFGGFTKTGIDEAVIAKDESRIKNEILSSLLHNNKGVYQPGLKKRRELEYKMWSGKGKIPGYNEVGYYYNHTTKKDVKVTPGEVVGGTVVSGDTSGDQNSNNQQGQSSIFNIFGDLGDALKKGMDSMYGFSSGTQAASAVDQAQSGADQSNANANQNPQQAVDQAQSGADQSNANANQNPQQAGQGGSLSSGIGLDGSINKTADNYFIRTLKGVKTSGIDPDRMLKGQRSPHYGIDYAAKGGTPITSPINGKVVTNSNEQDGFGNYLAVKDEKGQTHYFGHMNKRSNLKVGETVHAGSKIGNVGSTGFSTGNHLHYEVRDNSGNRIDPNSYLNSYAGKQPIDMTKNVGNGKGGQVENAINKVNAGNNSKILEMILKLLTKIAENSENLTKIVEILSENTNEETKKAIKQKLAQNKNKNKKEVPVQAILADSLKNNSNEGNNFIFNVLTALASE